MIWFSLVLWYINYCRLFKVKSCLFLMIDVKSTDTYRPILLSPSPTLFLYLPVSIYLLIHLSFDLFIHTFMETLVV